MAWKLISNTCTASRVITKKHPEMGRVVVHNPAAWLIWSFMGTERGRGALGAQLHMFTQISDVELQLLLIVTLKWLVILLAVKPP